MRGFFRLIAVWASGDALADAKAGEKKAQLCLLCHKPGNVMAHAPLLEAQPAKYLVIATTDYKTGKRPDSVMKANVANLFSSRRLLEAPVLIPRSRRPSTKSVILTRWRITSAR